MNIAQAKMVFASLMETARKRQLTKHERAELTKARQMLRRAKRPATNPSPKFGEWKMKQDSVTRRWMILKGNEVVFTFTKRSDAIKKLLDVRALKPRKNPPKRGVKIYGRILRIEAQKTQPHLCDVKCKRAGHRYFHDFTSRNASIYGMPDGSLVVRS